MQIVNSPEIKDKLNPQAFLALVNKKLLQFGGRYHWETDRFPSGSCLRLAEDRSTGEERNFYA